MAFSPILVAAEIDCWRDYSKMEFRHLLAMNEDELSTVDPLVMNLLVAKEIDGLKTLDIARYQATVNGWVEDFRTRCLPYWETFFHEAPGDFRNDIRNFRLGMVCQYIDLELGISYRPDQRDITSIHYTEPSDLFLNGIIDTGFGTCGNMSALHVAFGWRMGWPVSLACVGTHFVCRYEDEEIAYNVETTNTGKGGWSCRTDEEFLADVAVPKSALRCGSDLRALSKRELLGIFVALRARHICDVGKATEDEGRMIESESDLLLSRYLFPRRQDTYKFQMAISAIRGETLFDEHETGHPVTFAEFLEGTYRGRQRPSAHCADTSSTQTVSTTSR